VISYTGSKRAVRLGLSTLVGKKAEQERYGRAGKKARLSVPSCAFLSCVPRQCFVPFSFDDDDDDDGLY